VVDSSTTTEPVPLHRTLRCQAVAWCRYKYDAQRRTLGGLQEKPAPCHSDCLTVVNAGDVGKP
jgi:hypothetical protein